MEEEVAKTLTIHKDTARIVTNLVSSEMEIY